MPLISIPRRSYLTTKEKTMTIRNFVRPAKLMLAALVAVATLAIVGKAAQTITTPNAASFTYSLAPGASSGNITPAANIPVMILADQTGVTCNCDDVGSSLMTVVNSTVDKELVWNGFESNKGGLTAGFSPTAGTHIMFIDFGHLVDLEVSNATSFHVHNSSTSGETYNGNVTLIW
jgi:hypothetical protein